MWRASFGSIASPISVGVRRNPFPGTAEGLVDASPVVTDDAAVVEVDAELGETLRDPGAVRIDDFAEKDLGADGDDLCFHGRESKGKVGRLEGWGVGHRPSAIGCRPGARLEAVVGAVRF
jgi:hypothetical protein